MTYKKAQSIGVIAHQILTPLFQKHKHLQLMVDWPLVVGQEIAAYSWPEKIVNSPHTGAILYIRSQHMLQAWAESAHIIERVNQYMGYMAITRICFSKKAN